MNILVTGAAGLLGTELCLLLKAKGHNVIGIDNGSRYGLIGETGPRAQVENFNVLKAAGVEVLDEDLTEFSAQFLIRDRNITRIIHAAAQVCHSRKDDVALDNVDSNIVATVRLLDDARRIDGEPSIPFLFISSSKVYGENFDDFVAPNGIDETCPLGDQTHITFFGASKVAADLLAQMYARQYGMTVGCLRPGCFTGSYALATEAQNWFPWLVHCAKNDKVFRIFGDGTQERDLLHSLDLARACLLWCEHPTSGVWNIGGGPERVITVKAAVKWIGKVRTEICSRRPGDIQRLVIDSRKFIREYGWRPEISLGSIFESVMEAS